MAACFGLLAPDAHRDPRSSSVRQSHSINGTQGVECQTAYDALEWKRLLQIAQMPSDVGRIGPSTIRLCEERLLRILVAAEGRAVVMRDVKHFVMPVPARGDVGDQVEDLFAVQLVQQPFGHQ